MIKPTRTLLDAQAGRYYYVDSQNNAYADARFVKRLKCGLGHKMWSQGEFIVCDECNAKIKCQVV